MSTDPGAPSAAICEVSFTYGLADYVLSGAIPGHYRFADAYADGDPIKIEAYNHAAKEVVDGIYRVGPPETISRTVVRLPTSGAKIAWPTTGQRYIRPLIGGAGAECPPAIEFGTFERGVPGNGVITRWDAAAEPGTFPADFAGSNARSKTAATSTATGAINLIHLGASTPIGSFVFSPGGNVATFSSTGHLPHSFVADDLAEIVYSSPSDATLADVALTLWATRDCVPDLPPLPPPPPPPPGPGPVIDGSSSGYATNQSTVDNQHNIIGQFQPIAQTTGHSNTVLVAFVTTVGSVIIGGGSPTAAPTVSGIAGAGLVFSRRAGMTSLLQRPVAGTIIQANVNLEEWYAVAPTPLTNANFVATLNGTALGAVLAIQAFAGVNTGVIWDSNVSLPQIGVKANVSPTDTISTDNPSTTVITYLASTAGFATFLPRLPFRGIAGGEAGTGFPGRLGYLGAAGDFSSRLSSYLIQPWPGYGLNGQALFLVDALTA